MRRMIIVAALLLMAAPSLAQTSTPSPTPGATSMPSFFGRTPTPLARGFAICGWGLPCGQIPWRLPSMPDLASPTPYPTSIITATPPPTGTLPTITPGGPTATATATSTPIPTSTPSLGDLDTSPISDTVATWQAIISATQPPILVNGTPMDGVVIDGLEDDAREFFGRVQGLTSVSLGKISPLITWLLFAVGVLLFVTATTFLLPVIMAVFGVIRKLVLVVLDFLPL